MRRDWERRVRRLEHAPRDGFSEKLSALARKLGLEPERCLRLVRG